jgi:hypothetical protein
MALRTVRQEAGPRERQPKMLKSKLAKGEPSGSSPVRSDGSHDGHAGGWTMLMVVKGTHGESWKTILESKEPNQRQAWWKPKNKSTCSFSGNGEQGR